jgi:hypothetical protein
MYVFFIKKITLTFTLTQGVYQYSHTHTTQVSQNWFH